MCNWQCQDTGTMNRSLRLTECSHQSRGGRGELTECFATNFVVDVGNWGVFALYFVGGKETFTKCSQRVRNLFDYIRKMFATCWLSVCYILTEQKGGFCIAKVWFLACKKGVFDGQK